VKLASKLALALLLVAVVPLALSGWASTRINEQALTGKIEDLQQSGAKELAREIERLIQEALREVQAQLGYIHFRDFNPDEIEGGLTIVYLQNDAINVVSLLDERGEAPAGVPSRYVTDVQDHDERFRNKSEMTLKELEEFARHIPFAAAREQGTAIGEVYVSPRKQMALLPMALAVEGPARARWVLGLEYGLAPVQDLVASKSWGSPGGAFLVNESGRLIAHRDIDRVMRRESLAHLGIVERVRTGATGFGVERFEDAGEEMLGAFARLPTLGWGLVLFHPLSDALVSVKAIRAQTFFWIGASLAFAGFLGFFFARGITRPVNRLADGARRIAQGQLDHRIEVRARDEIAQLSGAFNAMGADLQKYLQQIAEQNRELERWNQELQRRVEERTRELKEAQDQLLLSHKLAAVGELGAGVAHEMNNPLAGVLGLAQLLLLKVQPDDPAHASLKAIEKEALRMREIVQSLLRFAQGQDSGPFAPTSLSRVCDDALAMLETQLAEQKIEVVRDYGEDVPRVLGNPSQLQLCVLHLLTNARTAMPQGGRLTIRTDHLEHKVARVRVIDTGRGIPKEHLDKIFEPFFTTKEEWSGKGLGLSVAYRIVQDHQGKISVESEPGRGAIFTLSFPSLPEKTHLV
jgi:signal transduction histidine kinase